ncbi:MAG: NAD-binding protein [Acidimicrobiia bacterium]|nr:NAD-binding protein [Acidimicrobiia bacterium]
MSTPIAVIGLGIMGSRLAGRLLDAGFALRGYDPDPERADDFRRAGGTMTSSPAQAVEGGEIALLSLLTSGVSREVCLGNDGIASSLQRPLLVLDATTGPTEDARSIGGELAAVGIDYADMTVSGNAAVAQRGELVVMLGGSDAAYEKARPIMEAIGRSHHHIGPVGSGATMKLIVNHALAVHRGVLGEALVVAEQAGLDPASALTVLEDSAAYSRAMDLWGQRMVDAVHDQPNARLRQSHKDARLILEHAAALGAPADLMAVAQQQLQEGEEGGLGDLDNSSVIEVVRRRAGIGRIPNVERGIEGDDPS